MRRLLADALVALGLLGLFVAIAGALGPHFHHMTQASTVATPIVDYEGTWDCRTITLTLKIEIQGQQLVVTNLDNEPAIFERDSEQKPFHEKGGERLMIARYNHLTLTLADGKEYDFERHE